MDPTPRRNVSSDGQGRPSRDVLRRIFSRYWDDVAPLNNYSPQAAAALLAREAETMRPFVILDGLSDPGSSVDDPWLAVQLGLRERAAGRVLSRNT